MQYKITNAQKDWREKLRSLGCIITGEPNPEMHHLYGAAAKKKCPVTFQTLWIGQWAQVPLCKPLHESEKTPEFRAAYSNADLFRWACEAYIENYGPLPFDEHIKNAILNY